MAVLYKLYQINRTFKDGRKDSANGKWFARAVHVETMGIDQIAESISYSTTLTKADCRAVVEALITVMQDAMNNSKKVNLPGIGTFKLSIQSDGALEASDFSVSNNIKGFHVVYTPSYTRDIGTGKKLSEWTQNASAKECPINTVGAVID